MNFFKIKTTWSNAELIVLKACIALAYILVGSYFHHFFSQYYVAFLVVFGITLIWALYLWIHKMKM
jgi:hypothetical protein